MKVLHFCAFFFLIFPLWEVFLPDTVSAQTSFVTPDPSTISNLDTKLDTITASQQDALMDLLNSSLQSLSDKDRRGRMAGSYVLLGLGAGTAVGGAVTLAAAKNDDARIVGYSLIGGGAFLSGLSLLPFKIKSESERLYADFKKDLQTTPVDRDQKFYYWDRRFEELAQKRKKERIIGGISSIVAGSVASIATQNVTDQDRLHIFIWPAIGGVTSILVKSEEEQRYATYQRAKADILGPLSVADMRLGIIPLPKGGLLSSIRIEF